MQSFRHNIDRALFTHFIINLHTHSRAHAHTRTHTHTLIHIHTHDYILSLKLHFSDQEGSVASPPEGQQLKDGAPIALTFDIVLMFSSVAMSFLKQQLERDNRLTQTGIRKHVRSSGPHPLSEHAILAVTAATSRSRRQRKQVEPFGLGNEQRRDGQASPPIVGACPTPVKR